MVEQATIQKLLNCLGDGDTLLDAIDPNQAHGAIIGIHNSRNAAKADPRVGLHYSGAHWYARKPDGTVGDGYTAHYQPLGSAHFCQTFAAMIFTGRDRTLRAEDYAANVEKAVDFWLAYLDEVNGQGIKMQSWLVKRLRVTDAGLDLNAFRNLLLYARGSASIIYTWH